MIFVVLDPSPLTVCINCSFFTFILINGHSSEQIWHMASLYPTDGHGGGLASAAWARGLMLRKPGNSELAGGMRKGSSIMDAWATLKN